jgi:hypothetical protein
MRDDLDTRTTTGTRGVMGVGTMAGIAAAVLIIGALFLWPRDADRSASTGTTVGHTINAPAPTIPTPSPAAK